jgi:hypothetical protein
MRDAMLPIRGCHAQAALGDPALKGLLTLSLRVEANGKVSGVSAVEGPSTTHEPIERVDSDKLIACLSHVLTGRQIASASGLSTALIEIRLRPVSI